MSDFQDDRKTEIDSAELADQESRRGSATASWTYADERRARRKVDFTVLPLLTTGLLVFQLDRMNLASALTGGFKEDIHIDQNTVNTGNQLMFMGIVLLEIPSNMLLQKVGPRKYMPLQVFVFGLVACLQVFVKDRAGFLCSRTFLGLAEAGYIPGSVFILSTWYTKAELARRIAIFFFGMFGGNALSPLLASGILKMDGVRRMQGWKWLFLLEGLLTVCISFCMLLFLPGSPSNPKPLLISGLVKFTSEDQRILQARLESGDGNKLIENSMIITPAKVWKTVSHWRRWPHFVCTCVVFATWAPLTTYTPTIYMKLGFERIEANALAAVGGFASLFVVLTFAWFSDRTKQRGLAVALAITCYMIALIVLRTVHPHVGKWSRYALWTVVNAFATGYHPVHNTWVQLNCNDPEERSISIAMWVMSAISGLMAGSQIFRQNDAPFYRIGVSIMIGMVGFGLIMCGVQVAVYFFHNRKIREEDFDPVEKEGGSTKIRRYVY